MKLRLPLAASCILLAGCANYDFSRARLPSGEWDFGKLAADLKASGEDRLHDTIWIPLIWLNATTFRASPSTMPDGFTLQHVKSGGPIFCVGSAGEQVVDPAGASIERRDGEWYVWGLPFFRATEVVQTPHGERIVVDSRTLLLIDNSSKGYRQQKL